MTRSSANQFLYIVCLSLFLSTTYKACYFRLVGTHRNIRPRMRAPILFQVNKWRLINYSKWPIYKGKLNSPHDILYTTLLGKIQDGGFIRAFLFSFWIPVTWQSTHSRSNISMWRPQNLASLFLKCLPVWSTLCGKNFEFKHFDEKRI